MVPVAALCVPRAIGTALDLTSPRDLIYPRKTKPTISGGLKLIPDHFWGVGGSDQVILFDFFAGLKSWRHHQQ